MSSPFDKGCVVLSKGGPLFGVTFRVTPKDEFGATYGQFLWAWYANSGELAVVFSHHVVTLRGRNLQQLVEQFAQQRVVEVRVAARNELFSGSAENSGEAVIQSIQIEDREMGGKRK